MANEERYREIAAATIEELLHSRTQEVAAEIARRVAAEIPEPPILVDDPLSASLEATAGNLMEVRDGALAIAATATQTETLNSLIAAAATITPGCGLLILRGTQAVGWSSRGLVEGDRFKRVVMDCSHGAAAQVVSTIKPTEVAASELDKTFTAALGLQPQARLAILPVLLKERVAALLVALAPLGNELPALEILLQMAQFVIDLQAYRKTSHKPEATAPTHAPAPAHAVEAPVPAYSPAPAAAAAYPAAYPTYVPATGDPAPAAGAAASAAYPTFVPANGDPAPAADVYVPAAGAAAPAPYPTTYTLTPVPPTVHVEAEPTIYAPEPDPAPDPATTVVTYMPVASPDGSDETELVATEQISEPAPSSPPEPTPEIVYPPIEVVSVPPPGTVAAAFTTNPPAPDAVANEPSAESNAPEAGAETSAAYPTSLIPPTVEPVAETVAEPPVIAPPPPEPEPVAPSATPYSAPYSTPQMEQAVATHASDAANDEAAFYRSAVASALEIEPGAAHPDDGLAAAAAALRQSAAHVAMTQPTDEARDKARRFAKLLVEEIKLYNQTKVAEGRTHHDLYIRLREDIEKSRAAYQKRYGETVRDVDYFSQELVRILADNNRSMLGPGFQG